MTDTLPSNKPNPPKGGFLWIFKARILECFGYTTAHGFGRVADLHDSRPRRWFWLLACAAAFGVFAYQFHDLTCQFLSRPLKTRTWIANHEVRLELKHANLTVTVIQKVIICLCGFKLRKVISESLMDEDVRNIVGYTHK